MSFINFTCHQWLPLIDSVNGYDIGYKWFDHLKSKGDFINTVTNFMEMEEMDFNKSKA